MLVETALRLGEPPRTQLIASDLKLLAVNISVSIGEFCAGFYIVQHQIQGADSIFRSLPVVPNHTACISQPR
jgi:hypothetical protein